MFHAKNLIHGTLIESGNPAPVINPATEAPCGTQEKASIALADEALLAAKNAFPVYSHLSINERASLIMTLREKIISRKEGIIDLLVAETGKTNENAGYDFSMLVDCLAFFIEEVKRHYAKSIPDYDNKFFNQLVYEPTGVVAAFLAWNFPLLNLGYKLGPILASGCTCVIKPSAETPLATALVGELIAETAFPAGTVNIVLGESTDIGYALAHSNIPRLLTMIGSTYGGMKLIENSTSSVKRFSLELGGNAPVIVFDDADVNTAVEAIVDLKFSNAGQICVAPNRVFVHEKVYASFLSKAKRLAEAYTPGSGACKAPAIQPVISKRAFDRILASIDTSMKDGANLICGGTRMKKPGYFIAPTILETPSASMDICANEIFGPVMPIVRFTDTDDIFAVANECDAGLASYLFTDSNARIMDATERLLYGNICVNGVHYSIQLPHGGLKQSGYGKDIGHLCLDDYFDVKRVSVRR
ncbi:MAG: aldehyde dehydrogenase family protein [Spirochaetota bacterium]|mgnify:CR=1 FL=1